MAAQTVQLSLEPKISSAPCFNFLMTESNELLIFLSIFYFNNMFLQNCKCTHKTVRETLNDRHASLLDFRLMIQLFHFLWLFILISILDAFASPQSAHKNRFVRPYVSKCAITTVRIFAKFDIEEFCKNLRSRFKFRLDEWFVKCAPKRLANISQGIRGYISVTATLNFPIF